MGLFSKKNRKPERPAATPVSELNPEPPPVQEQAPPTPDPVKELERLEGMRDRGMLTPEEFTIEKRKIQASQSFRRI